MQTKIKVCLKLVSFLSKSKFPLQYQNIIKQAGDENKGNHWLSNSLDVTPNSQNRHKKICVGLSVRRIGTGRASSQVN